MSTSGTRVGVKATHILSVREWSRAVREPSLKGTGGAWADRTSPGQTHRPWKLRASCTHKPVRPSLSLVVHAPPAVFGPTYRRFGAIRQN